MEYFLDTVKTIPKGLGFQHFDLCHIQWLVLFAGCIVVFSGLYRRWDEKKRRIFRIVLATLIVGNEIFKQVCLQLGDTFTVNYLPLHLCSINIFLVAVHAFKPSKTLDNFLYAICIPAALLALFFPTWTKLPFLNFNHLHSFTVHIMLALYPIVLTIGGDIRPNVRQIPKSLLLLLGFAAVALVVNFTLDTNYMYLMSAPKGTPLVWFENTFGTHLIGFPVLLVAILALMYAPVIVLERRRKKHAAETMNP